MANLNRVLLIGNCGNDPEIRNIQENAKVASFRIATTERYTDRNGEKKENTEWHQISAWNKAADIVERFVKKGSKVFVEGKITTRKWTDKDGNERQSTEIRAEGIQLLGKKEESTQVKPAPAEESPALRQLKAEDDNPEQDLPF